MLKAKVEGKVVYTAAGEKKLVIIQTPDGQEYTLRNYNEKIRKYKKGDTLQEVVKIVPEEKSGRYGKIKTYDMYITYDEEDCPEAQFYIVEGDDVHIEGELLYNGDGQLELLEYTWLYVPKKDCKNTDLVAEMMREVKQYYQKLTNEEGYEILNNYFDPKWNVKRLDFKDITEETPNGCYISYEF